MNELRRICTVWLAAVFLAPVVATTVPVQAQVAFRGPQTSNYQYGPVRMNGASIAPQPTRKPRFDWNEDDANANLPRVTKANQHVLPGGAPIGSGVVKPAVGYVPAHAKVRQAQLLEDEPMRETLPAPLDPFGSGMPQPDLGPPATAAPGGMVPSGNGRRVIRREGSMMFDEGFAGEVPFGGDVFGPTGAASGCAGCGSGDCGEMCGGPECVRDCYPCFDLRNLDIYSGVAGFTNSTNRGGAGSFGYTIGMNKGRPLLCFPCSSFSMQYGVAGNFSNFDGAAFAHGAALATTPDSRNQLFLTGGIFRRVDWGLQGGVVFDYLHDEWYSKADLGQLRGEISWVYPYCHEIGFWFAGGVNNSNQTGRVFVGGVPIAVNESWEAADLYAFFYRRRFEQGGEGRLFGGFSGDGDGLFGSDFFVPLNNNWGIQGGYTYLLPKDDDTFIGNANEAWNVSINLVWSPGPCRNFGPADYNRPLLPVANNGNFILKRRLLP